ARTIQARRTAADLTLKDATGADKSGWKVLYTTGRVEASFRVPRTGEHTLRVRAYGEHTGAEVVKVALLADDKEIKRFDVPGDEKKPDLLEVKLRLDTGDRKISVSFLNGGDAKKHDRRLGIDYVELEGPPEKGGLPWAHATYFDKRPPLGAKPEVRKALAKEVLAPVASRAWRRPARPDELEKLAKLVELAVTENESWERGLQLALQAILCSPSFIFRLELEAQRKGDAEVLDEHALATRLSYFLWSSLPDDELKNEADQGTLRKNIVAETKRLLADPRASRLTEQFAVQWLHLRRLDGFVPDPGAFPNFDDALRQAARSETEHLFETILREDRPVRDLVDADFTFVNERLARHYGIEGVSGAEMQRVPAPPERRGLLGHASVLMATSNPTRTSPVKRGRWVLEVLLDEPPPPPVAGADSFTDSERAAKTLRERLEIHRSKPECATCHSRMDPLGFALERFDPIGAIREKDGENPIDDEGALPDKTKLAGATGLRTWLAARSGRIARALAKKLLIFATGRGSIAGDEDPLDQVIDACAPDYKLQDLIVALVQLDAFQKRRANGGK
ncbi:MAG TPA: DUF1592 domain-containing protein, partial [Planctomycetota bacterium]|nr:DUF1592 domain-containing protein [Planctomycetota bacterium]